MEPMSPLPTILFDLDGTLCDTFDDLTTAVNAVRAARGLPPVSKGRVMSHVGLGADVLVQGTCETRDDADVAACRAAFLDEYDRHLTDWTRLYPGARECLDRLGDRAVLAVLTNKPAPQARRIVEALGLAPRLRAVFGAGSFPVLKPDPGAILGALAAVGGTSEAAWMVGDSDIDVLAARNAGIPAILVRTGLHFTVTQKPDAWVEDLSRLPGLLGLEG